MWKLLWLVILVAVLSTYHADANRERSKRAVKNNYRIQNLQPPIVSSLKGQDAIVVEGYDYPTPKPKGYVYTPGYVYRTPVVKISTTAATKKPSTPGTTYLPPTTTSTTTTTTTTTTPSTTTTTSTTTPSTTTTTSTTTPSTTTTTFKPSYLPPHEYTYLPPSTPSTVYIPVKISTMPYPKVSYGTISTERTRITRINPYPIRITPTMPRPTTQKPLVRGYEYLPPKEYLPSFETRK